jgi:Polysaccharide lyase/Bacterial Ig domain
MHPEYAHGRSRALIAMLTCVALLALPGAASARKTNTRDRTPPSLSFATPLNGGNVSGQLNEANGNCRVSASDNVGVSKVVFYLDGQLLNTESYSPWSCVWDTATATNGAHTLKAVAYDSAGNSAATQISVNVANSTSSPTSGTDTSGGTSGTGTSGTGTTTTTPPLYCACFDNGLNNWNLGGLGDGATPTVQTDFVRQGTGSGKITLTGTQTRDELILADNNGNRVLLSEGDDRYYAFSFYLRSMVWGAPGLGHNVIWQFHQVGSGNVGSPWVALSLLNFSSPGGYDGKQVGQGLWGNFDWLSPSGPGTGGNGDIKLSGPLAMNTWYDVVVHVKASKTNNGAVQVWLNGNLIYSISGVSTMPYTNNSDNPNGFSQAQFQNGLYRGSGVTGTSEYRLDSVRFGTSYASVQPG